MKPTIFSFSSMGTLWTITIWDEMNEVFFKEFQELVIFEADEFDGTYSRFIEDSLVTEISRTTGVIEVPSDFTKMLKIYFDFYELTDRKLNPLIGNTLCDLGYDAKYSLTPQATVRKTEDLFETILILDEYHIDIKKPMTIDLGAIGKGYFVDKLRQMFVKNKIEKFLIDGSGDVYYQGKDPIEVGLEDPRDAKKVIGKLEIKNVALCGSGTNKRAWRDYHHVIDPHTSLPTIGIKAVWALASTCVMSDALASALFFVSPEKMLEKYKFEYLLMNEEGKVKKSTGFEDALFINN